MENIDTEEIVENEEVLSNPVEIVVEKPDKRKAKDNPKRSKQLEQLKLAREKKKTINLAKKQKRQEIEIKIQKEMNETNLEINPIEEKSKPILVEKIKTQKRSKQAPKIEEIKIEENEENFEENEEEEEEQEEHPLDPEPMYSDPRIPIHKTQALTKANTSSSDEKKATANEATTTTSTSTKLL